MSDEPDRIEARLENDRRTAREVLSLVYEELRRLAAAKLRAEAPGHTLDATALVHEAFLKLGGDRSFASRLDFFRAAGEAMRRILVDHARRRNALKRGGDRREQRDADSAVAPQRDVEVVALDEALTRLATEQPQVVELVHLRFYAGLTIPEAAALLGISPRTANGWWAYARGWLAAEIRRP
jgi:RNA polymerase sigma factor (TIGR02999 family)